MTKQDKNCVEQLKEIIKEKFEECPVDKKPALFIKLETWAKADLPDRVANLFITALYESPYTQEAQMVLSLNRVLDGLLGR